MRLFRRNRNPSAPADPLAVPPSGGSRIDWRRALPRVLAVLVITAVIVLGIFWAAGAFNNNHGSHDRKPVAGRQNPKPQIAQKGTSGAGKSSPAATPSTQPSPTTPAQTPGNQPAGSAAQSPVPSGNLTNTGPGETVGLFVAVTITGAAAYQVRLRRRLN